MLNMYVHGMLLAWHVAVCLTWDGAHEPLGGEAGGTCALPFELPYSVCQAYACASLTTSLACCTCPHAVFRVAVQLTLAAEAETTNLTPESTSQKDPVH